MERPEPGGCCSAASTAKKGLQVDNEKRRLHKMTKGSKRFTQGTLDSSFVTLAIVKFHLHRSVLGIADCERHPRISKLTERREIKS